MHFGLGFPLPFGAASPSSRPRRSLNLALRIRFPASHRLSDNAATLLLGFDILQLAGLLYLTGGLQNPFAMLLLAPVLISATALPPERTLALGCLAVGWRASLLALAHQPLPWAGQALELPFLYVGGVWAAILLGMAFTAVYAWRVAEEARQLAEALAATELVLAREQHLSRSTASPPRPRTSSARRSPPSRWSPRSSTRDAARTARCRGRQRSCASRSSAAARSSRKLTSLGQEEPASSSA